MPLVLLAWYMLDTKLKTSAAERQVHITKMNKIIIKVMIQEVKKKYLFQVDSLFGFGKDGEIGQYK